jgi:PKD repeat protein
MTLPSRWAGGLALAALAGLCLAAGAAGALPDLRVSIAVPPVGVDGEDIQVTITVTNAGTTPSGYVTANISLDGAFQASSTWDDLAVGQTSSQDHGIALACGHHNLTAYVDSTQTVAESDESNNNATSPVRAAANAAFTHVLGGTLGSHNITAAAEGSPGCGAVAYAWDAGDNGAFTGSPVTFGVLAGNFTLRLTVTPASDAGLAGHAEANVSVPNAPPVIVSAAVADEEVDTGATIGLLVLADDIDGSVDVYLADFGDGNTSGDFANFSEYRYGRPGNYTIAVRVTDNLGAVAEASVQVRVVNRPPVAQAALKFVFVEAGHPQVFNATPSSDPDHGPLAFHWDFGDGATADGAVVNHTYASQGGYTATLTATDEWGASATVEVSVTVLAPQGGGGGSALLTGAALAVLGAAVLFYLWRTRWSAPGPEDAPPAAPPPSGPPPP